MLKIQKREVTPEILNIRLIDLETIISQIRSVDDIFSRHNISYCAVGGMLLGCVRHQGFIPWDDDFDILVNSNDMRRSLILLKNIGFTTIRYVESPVKKQTKTAQRRYDINTPISVDETIHVIKNEICSHIFPYRKLESSILTLNGEFADSVTFPFQRLKFEDFSIMAPQDPKHYLDISNPNWDKELAIRGRIHGPIVYSSTT